MIIIEVDIELYKIFYMVAKYQNITKAAESLYISQPAVTMSIKKLEEQLDTTLFVRTKRGVILTSEGEVLNEYISKAMENIELGENRISSLKKLESGNIKIGIGTTLAKHFLMDYLNQYHSLYPKVSINIDTSMTNEIIKKLGDGALDVAIIVSDETSFNNLKIEYETDIEYIFIGNKEFKDKIGKNVSISKLNEYPLILQSIRSNSRQFLEKVAKRHGVTLEASMELTSYSLVIEFVKIGMGVGFTSREYVKKELESGELFEIDLKDKIPIQKIMVLTRKGYIPSFSCKKLVQLIKDTYK